MPDIHVRRRDSNHAHGSRRALDLPRKAMRRVNPVSSLRDRLFRGEEVVTFDLEIVAGNCVCLEARLTESCAAMILPVVPWTCDVFAIERPIRQRTASVIAHS